MWLSSWLSFRPILAGMDGNRTHPGRLSSAPQTVLKTAGGTSPRTSPAGKMLFRQRDSDALDAERLRVPGEQTDEEAQHPINLRRPGDRGHQRWLRRPKGAKPAISSHTRKAPRPGREERDPHARVAVPGMDQRQWALPPNLPGTYLLSVDPALQGAQEALPTRILTGVDRNLHG